MSAFRSAWSLSDAQWDKILSAALARVQARVKATVAAHLTLAGAKK